MPVLTLRLTSHILSPAIALMLGISPLTLSSAAAQEAGAATPAPVTPSVNDYRLRPGRATVPQPEGPVDADIPRPSATDTPSPAPTPSPVVTEAVPARASIPNVEPSAEQQSETGRRTEPNQRRVPATQTPDNAPEAPVAPAATAPAIGPDASDPAPPIATEAPSAPAADATDDMPSMPSAMPAWIWAVAALILALAGLAAWRKWRRSEPAETDVEPQDHPNQAPYIQPQTKPEASSPQPSAPASIPAIADPPAPQPAPQPVAAPAPAGSAIELAVAVRRIDRTLVNLTMLYEISIRNNGDATLSALTITGDMIGAHASRRMDDLLANDGQALPALHQIVELAADETRVLTGEIRLPLNAITPLQKGKALMFVPIMRIHCIAGQDNLAAAAYLLGINNNAIDGRLSPLRLDQGARSFTPIAVRLLASSDGTARQSPHTIAA